MSRQATRNTAPELALRRELHRRGLRYRIAYRPLPGLRTTADIVFTRQRLAVYVDGCFWHSCPEHATTPASNRDWWIEKLRRNRERDREIDETLSRNGWRVVRIWEHEEMAAAAEKVRLALASPGSAGA
jgi:DNA mismatch endonuclease (patch repair protein)